VSKQRNRFDANADYGVVSGSFVRLDITPEGTFGSHRCECADSPGRQAWIGLTPDEAFALAARLEDQARYVLTVRAKGGETDAYPQ
jgi:hypothetical protein